MIAYRRDIDGLRAVAVVAVVLYHAGLSALPGGFVGVDIFFVISGYLITSIIAREMAEGRFSTVAFYDRRIRRLFPALAAMLAGTVLAALVILPPFDLEGLGETLPGAVGFFSNLHFWSKSGYFAPAARTLPLLHTWSLAVEEQFYILWPLLVIAMLKWRRGSLMLLAIGLGSLALAEYQLRIAPDAAFYLLPTRIFEFVCGAALALGLVSAPRRRGAVAALSVLGLALVLAPILLYDEDTAFPGFAALIPCLGAALVILTGPDAPVSRLLGRQPFVFVGKISYSLYLWHWPVFVLAEAQLGRPLTTAETGLALAGILVLSVLSWRFVEQPFRRSSPPTARKGIAGLPRSFAAALGIIAVFVATGVMFRKTDGLGFRANPEVAAEQARMADAGGPRLGKDCARFSRVENVADCIYGTGPVRIVVWGDSHARHFAPSFLARAAKGGYAVLQASETGCPPLFDVDVLRKGVVEERCRAAADKVRAEIQARPDVMLVVMAARWSLYAHDPKSPLDRLPTPFLVDGRSDDMTVDNTRRVLADGLERTAAQIEQAGRRVMLMQQTPEFGFDPSKCLIRALWRSQKPDCDEPKDDIYRRMAISEGILTGFARRHPSIIDFDPWARFCDAATCRPVETEAGSLFRDFSHLARAGGEKLAPALPLPAPL